MKKVLSLTLTLAFLATSSLYADIAAGKKLVNAKCKSCHDPVKDQLASSMGPSWKMVTEAYTKNGKADLIKFWQGEAPAKLNMVNDSQKNTMKGQLKNAKKWSDAEKSDAADYILSN